MDYAVTYEELTDFIAKKKEEIANIWTERAVFIRSEPELPAGTVIDREKSVRWNEEEVWHRNNSRKGKLASFQAKINACNKAISEKIIEYIRSEYEFTEPVAHIVFNAAYERGHSCGYEEVIHDAREYAEFTERLFTAMDLR